MPVIRPVSDLKNKSTELLELAHGLNEPIFITKKGEGDAVLMSLENYHRLEKKIELMQKLFESEQSIQQGKKPKPWKEVLNKFTEKWGQ